MVRRLVVLAAGFVIGGSPAFALDVPARKPGLWELKMAFENSRLPERVMQQCIDAATDKLMNTGFGGGAQENCSKQDTQHIGSTLVIDSTCTFGPATTTSHAVVTGSFDSAYSVDVTSTRQGAPAPGMAPTGSTHMKMEAKWLGPCAADQKPGDVITDGRKMNLLDLQKMRAPKEP